ncbi:MAG: EamA family transporter [Mesorhizobium amorphae]|nr:MAG: EamA family transporter [Mesorhizobium amorphae]
MPLSRNQRGALLMVVSLAGFTANDAVTKLAAQHMNVGQIMLLRGIIATGLISLLAWRGGVLRLNPELAHPIIVLRSVAEIVSTVCFLSALPHLPLANISAVMQFLPLAITMAAALFLGEQVGWRRWMAITAGFVGVMLIVQPGAHGFNAFALLALGSVGACVVRDLATARAPTTIPSMQISVLTSAGVMAMGGVLVVPFGGWSPVGSLQGGLLVAGAVLMLVGHQFLIVSTRGADLSFVAPFRYVALLFAFALGFLVFGEVPDAWMIAGSAIVVVSGIYLFHRERMRGASVAAESTTPSLAPDGL